MSSHTFNIPPETTNHEGGPRHVGVEIEFGSISTRQAAQSVHALFGGKLEQEDSHRYHVRDTHFGEFLIELDSQYVHRMPSDSEFTDQLKEKFGSIIGDISELVVPNEVVCPPVELDDLEELETLLDKLVELGAKGSSDNLLYAFGCQLNPEIASREPDYILSVLRAYMLMSAWLRAVIELDLTRRLSNFADPFPPAYAARVLAPDYSPSTGQLIDDYLTYNPTRNRELDMLPLFAWLDEDRVRARIADVLVKPRPTFHYRLPDAKIGQPDWSLSVEWNRWCVVERLAADAGKLRRMGRAVIDGNIRLNSSKWATRSTEWLLT